ncbi:MAG: hypothetical protein AB1420_18275 [Bacillota bacterium]
MPRQAREISSTGTYHIMLRGINRQIIFNGEEDKLKFMETLVKYKDICAYEIYGYCLMWGDRGGEGGDRGRFY